LAVFLVPGINVAAGFVGSLIGTRFTRKGTKEADNRGRREELMRQQRWAAELAVSDDRRKAQMGVGQLRALVDSPLLSEAEKALVDAALESAIHAAVAQIEATEKVGEKTRVVQVGVEGIDAAHLALENDRAATADEEVAGGA
jgi:hypothetical protein